jgi:hypothetical protein
MEDVTSIRKSDTFVDPDGGPMISYEDRVPGTIYKIAGTPARTDLPGHCYVFPIVRA